MNRRHSLELSRKASQIPSAVSALSSSVLFHHSSLATSSTATLKAFIIATYVRTQRISKMISKLLFNVKIKLQQKYQDGNKLNYVKIGSSLILCKNSSKLFFTAPAVLLDCIKLKLSREKREVLSYKNIIFIVIA